MTPTAANRSSLYIDGQFVDSSADTSIDVIDPSTQEIIARVPDGNAADVDRAVIAARRAFESSPWKDVTAQERGRILFRLAQVVRDHAAEWAELETRNNGKPIVESEFDIADVATCFEYYGGLATKIHGDVIPVPDNALSLALREPIGVAGQIIPWNYPLLMAAWKIAPAICAGCTMVLKPAEQTPLSALAIAALAEEAGVPPGVFSVVTGDAEDAPVIGRELTSNPSVRKLGFTGSTEVGKLLMRQCADQVKKISLELGGNAPFIVFDDADLDIAVNAALVCKFRNSGQTCVSANRMLVQAGIYDAFLDRFTASVEELTVADGFTEGVQVGPLIDGPALEKVETHVADALDGGAELVTGGERIEGQFFRPSVLTGVGPEMRMSREETFGPVAAISRFESEDEAVAIANGTPYGLAAYYMTGDLARTWRVGEALEYGILGVNTGLISTEVAPFGGVKESGIGREGSSFGVDDWTELKYWAVGGL